MAWTRTSTSASFGGLACSSFNNAWTTGLSSTDVMLGAQYYDVVFNAAHSLLARLELTKFESDAFMCADSSGAFLEMITNPVTY